MRGTAGAIFVFQEVAFLFGVVRLGEKGIDAALAALNVATSCNGGVDLVVGNEHTGLFNLCHVGGVLSAGQAVVRQIVQNSLRIIQTEAHETVVLLVCGGISGQFTDQLLTESRVFQSFSHALGCIRESSLSAICKAWHKALLSGSFTHVAVVIQKRFSHPCAFKALGFHDLHIGGVLAHLHELTDALGCGLPGDYLCRSGVTGAAPLCKMDTILTIPSGELTMVGLETGTADILFLKSSRNLCHGLLLFEFRSHNPAGIAVIAAHTEHKVDILLEKRKSEGCRHYTLRFINEGHLLLLRWEHSHVKQRQLLTGI